MKNSPKKVELVGGPNDGALVNYCGDRYMEPVAEQPVIQNFSGTDIPIEKEIKIRIYFFRIWQRTPNGPKFSRYVLESHLKGLKVEL